MSQLHVIAPGSLTTVQDLGRWGFQSSGVSVSGPMDLHAHRLANALVGNAADDAGLEVTMAGPELECDEDRVVALTGAEFELTVDSEPVPMHTAIALGRRARLKCGRRLRGARAYLAVAGGIAVPRVLGSRSTHLASAIGGLAGRPLRAGDVLPLGTPRGRGARLQLASDLPAGHAHVRILPGPHQDHFAPDALTTLQASPYRIDPRSDRIGFRLAGVPLAHRRDGEMISDVMPMGALQVPASGHPILLMADRPTTGGYPILAAVITADLGVAAQLAPGDAISFVVCSPAEAMAALIARERQIMAVAPQERP